MHRCKRLLAVIGLLIALGPTQAGDLSDTELINRIMRADQLPEILERPSTDIEGINFLLDVPKRLFAVALNQPKNSNVWNAIHRFRAMTDAGLTTSFQTDCFDALKRNNRIFYDRFMSGDDLALSRMLDAMEANLIDEDGKILEHEKVNRKVLQITIEEIEKADIEALGTERVKRHRGFVDEARKKLLWREEVFKELFGNQ